MRGNAAGSQIPINGSGESVAADLKTVAMPCGSLSFISWVIFFDENRGKSQGTTSQAASGCFKKAESKPLIGPLDGTLSTNGLHLFRLSDN